MSTLQDETTDLLQHLIRNKCVNDGTPDSGREIRNADLLQTYLGKTGLDIARFESHPGRTSVVARIEGSDPAAPRLCLMAHTDVVPVNPSGWKHDPFGGELIDGEVWGRGAIDMLNLTASMAVAFRHLATSGFKPKGTLIYFGVADEEAGGHWGAEWMVDKNWDAIRADYVLTEAGGWSAGAGSPRQVVISVAEKGIAWRRLRVRGTPSHGSMPFATDNALVKAAEVVRRLAAYRPASRLDDVWSGQVKAMRFPADIEAGLLDPGRVWETLDRLPPPIARFRHAKTHTSFSPNVAHGGQKTNIVPDQVDIEVDIRTMPGTTTAQVDDYLRDALGNLYPHVEISVLQQNDASASPIGNPLWKALESRVESASPGAQLLPDLIVGGTDARFFRQKGAIAYGAGLLSPEITFPAFAARFHGNDERVDVASLGLATDLWIGVARDLLG